MYLARQVAFIIANIADTDKCLCFSSQQWLNIILTHLDTFSPKLNPEQGIKSAKPPLVKFNALAGALTLNLQIHHLLVV